MSKSTIRITRLTIGPAEAKLFDEFVTHVSIEDEAGGEFVELSQSFDGGDSRTIRIEPEEWETLSKAISQMVKECR